MITLNSLMIGALCKINTGAVDHDDWLKVVLARVTNEVRKGQSDGGPTEKARFSFSEKFAKATVTTKESFLMDVGNLWYILGYINQELSKIIGVAGSKGADFSLPTHIVNQLEKYAAQLAPSGAEPVPSN